MNRSVEEIIESLIGKTKNDEITYEDLLKLAVKIKDYENHIKEQNKEIELLQKDHLTKMGNRIQYERTIEYIYQVEFAIHPKRRFHLFLIDVDGLHMINRTRGFEEGDKLIKSISEYILNIVDDLPNTYVFRIGGDEFVVISDVNNYKKTKKILNVPHATATVIEFGKNDNFNKIFNKADDDIIKLKGNRSRDREIKECVNEWFKGLLLKPFNKLRNIFKR